MVAMEDNISFANWFFLEDRTGLSFLIANDGVAAQTGGGRCKVRAATDYDIDEAQGTGEVNLLNVLYPLR
jgi:hypothetical protein